MDLSAIETEDLRRDFGARRALDGVTLRVRRGEVFGLLGPNGGGKTTLFRILSTLLPASGGHARILGRDIERERGEVRARIGVVFQSPSLDRHLGVEENLRCQARLYGMSGRTARPRIRELLDRFGLGDRARDRAGELSGGLRRRVEIAKALLHGPGVLLLDEPSSGLDPGVRREIFDHLASLARRDGAAVCLTTHLLDEADGCDRIAILHEGRIVAEGAPDELRAEVGAEVLTIGSPDPAALAASIRERFGIGATVAASAVRIEEARAHDRVAALFEAFPGKIRSVTVARPTLEDVFIRKTGRRFQGDAA